MSERRDLGCGCAFVKPGGGGGQGQQWYQVVACPSHAMDMAPKDEPVVAGRPEGR